MSVENVKKFYDLVEKDVKLRENINHIDGEIGNDGLQKGELSDFIKEKIIPLAKSYNLDFTLDELMYYVNDKLKNLSDDQLDAISGGISPRNAALTLSSVLLFSIGAAAAVNLVVPEKNSPSQVISRSNAYKDTDDEKFNAINDSYKEDSKSVASTQEDNKEVAGNSVQNDRQRVARNVVSQDNENHAMRDTASREDDVNRPINLQQISTNQRENRIGSLLSRLNGPASNEGPAIGGTNVESVVNHQSAGLVNEKVFEDWFNEFSDIIRGETESEQNIAVEAEDQTSFSNDDFDGSNFSYADDSSTIEETLQDSDSDEQIMPAGSVTEGLIENVVRRTIESNEEAARRAGNQGEVQEETRILLRGAEAAREGTNFDELIAEIDQLLQGIKTRSDELAQKSDRTEEEQKELDALDKDYEALLEWKGHFGQVKDGRVKLINDGLQRYSKFVDGLEKAEAARRAGNQGEVQEETRILLRGAEAVRHELVNNVNQQRIDELNALEKGLRERYGRLDPYSKEFENVVRDIKSISNWKEQLNNLNKTSATLSFKRVKDYDTFVKRLKKEEAAARNAMEERDIAIYLYMRDNIANGRKVDDIKDELINKLINEKKMQAFERTNVERYIDSLEVVEEARKIEETINSLGYLQGHLRWSISLAENDEQEGKTISANKREEVEKAKRDVQAISDLMKVLEQVKTGFKELTPEEERQYEAFIKRLQNEREASWAEIEREAGNQDEVQEETRILLRGADAAQNAQEQLNMQELLNRGPIHADGITDAVRNAVLTGEGGVNLRGPALSGLDRAVAGRLEENRRAEAVGKANIENFVKENLEQGRPVDEIINDLIGVSGAKGDEGAALVDFINGLDIVKAARAAAEQQGRANIENFVRENLEQGKSVDEIINDLIKVLRPEGAERATLVDFINGLGIVKEARSAEYAQIQQDVIREEREAVRPVAPREEVRAQQSRADLETEIRRIMLDDKGQLRDFEDAGFRGDLLEHIKERMAQGEGRDSKVRPRFENVINAVNFGQKKNKDNRKIRNEKKAAFKDVFDQLWTEYENSDEAMDVALGEEQE